MLKLDKTFKLFELLKSQYLHHQCVRELIYHIIVMVNLMCQLGQATVPRYLVKYHLGVSVKTVRDKHLNRQALNKEDSPSKCRWTSSNQSEALKTGLSKKGILTEDCPQTGTPTPSYVFLPASLSCRFLTCQLPQPRANSLK